MEEGRRKYYWLLAQEPDTGKTFLVFGGLDEESARTKGLEVLGGIDFEIKALPTRAIATASQFIKGRSLEETHSLRKASKRIGHDRSLRRMRNKRKGGNSW